MKAKVDAPFVPLNIAVLTVSDTRTLETDTSGQVFVDRLSVAVGTGERHVAGEEAAADPSHH